VYLPTPAAPHISVRQAKLELKSKLPGDAESLTPSPLFRAGLWENDRHRRCNRGNWRNSVRGSVFISLFRPAVELSASP